jgi:hypothetical protein
VLIRIEGHDLPGSFCGPGPDYPDGHPNIHVAVQRRNKPDELWGTVRGDAAGVEWELDCTATPRASGVRLQGPFLQGGPDGRFIYLSWGVVEAGGRFTMFRAPSSRSTACAPTPLLRAVSGGLLVGRLGLTDEKGHPAVPRCGRR